jgi:hypothetical protein
MRSAVRSRLVFSRCIKPVITVAPSPAAASWSDAAVSVTSCTTSGSKPRRRKPDLIARPYWELSGGRIQSVFSRSPTSTYPARATSSTRWCADPTATANVSGWSRTSCIDLSLGIGASG